VLNFQVESVFYFGPMGRGAIVSFNAATAVEKGLHDEQKRG